MEKIEIELFDLPLRKEVQATESFIELHDTYYRHVAEYDCLSPKDKDDLLGQWDDTYYKYDVRIKRESFISCEIVWNAVGDHWQIELESTGYPASCFIYFKKQDEKGAYELFEKIFTWIFNL